MNPMQEALKRRMQSGLNISIEVEPMGMDADELQKTSDLAPNAKDETKMEQEGMQAMEGAQSAKDGGASPMMPVDPMENQMELKPGASSLFHRGMVAQNRMKFMKGK